MDILLLFVMVIGFMLIGVPIAISLGLASILFLLMHSDASLASVAQTLFNAFAGHYTLLAIPFFILASSFMSTGSGKANHPICNRNGGLVPWWSRHGIGRAISYDVCGVVWFFTSYCGCDRKYRYRWYGEKRLLQRVCCWCYL